MGSRVSSWFRRLKPFIAVVFIQVGYAGMTVLAKAAFNKGMSNYVFVAYRHAVATIVIAPFAVFLERRGRPRANRSTFIKIVALSLLEPVINQNLFFLGMKYTTATFTAATVNILPAFTFVIAWILRMEHVNVRSLHGQAKIFGTIATIAGAVIMTLARGPAIHSSRRETQTSHEPNGATDPHKFILGAFMIIMGCLSWAGFMILLAITLNSYPAKLSLTALICLLATLEGSILALIMERGNAAAWSIHWNIKLLVTVYSGVICSGLAYYLQGMVMNERGPVFVTAFNPLSLVAVAVMSSIILEEQMYLGRVIGAVVIVVGLYIVIWGKSRDHKKPITGADEQETVPSKEANDIEQTMAAARTQKEISS